MTIVLMIIIAGVLSGSVSGDDDDDDDKQPAYIVRWLYDDGLELGSRCLGCARSPSVVSLLWSAADRRDFC